MPLILSAGDDDSGRRLDRILRKALRETPLSAIHRLLRKGAILVDGKIADAALRINAGQTITVNINSEEHSKPAKQVSSPLPFGKPEILFEGHGLLVLNKPTGMPAHGRKSLETQVLSYLKLPPSLSFRPGPLHRLDRPSSGIIVFSTNLEGARFFSELLKSRKLKKCYLAIIEGKLENAETWQDELTRDKIQKKSFASRPGEESSGAAKTALTRVSPLAGNSSYTLIRAEIETGRTHQIRAQAASRGYPLLGDKKYGAKHFTHPGAFYLHAWRMEFSKAPSGIPHLIKAPLPENFRLKIQELFGTVSLF